MASKKRRQKGKKSSDLTPLRGIVTRKKFLVLDVESKDGDTQDAGFTRPFIIGVRDDEGNKYFFRNDENTENWPWDERYWRPGGCVDKAMRFVMQREFRGYHIYAHNAGRFDYLFLLPWIMHIGVALGFTAGIVPVSSSIQVIDLWQASEGDKGDKWRFLDSMKLIPTSLQKAAEGLGVTGKNREALGKEDLNLHEDDPRWEVYNGQDIDTLYEVVEKFHHYIEDILLGEVGITAPSTAVKLFRRQYLKKPVPRSCETHEFIRRSYFGGRVEPFIEEGFELSYFDVNSSYPASMRGMMPAGEATEWDGEPPARFIKSQLGFCEVDVYVPEDTHIPVLPVKLEEKLIFPTGNLTGIWTYPELMLAVECGATIIRWKHSVWYQPVDLFSGFVADLYSYRDKKSKNYNAALDAVVKIILNALYGKFAMKQLRKKIYLWNDPNRPECSVPAHGGPEALVWYAEEECDAPYIMPQVSAWITSKSRILLMRYMLQAIALGGKIYYCDTDSIITDVQLPNSTELGGLKDEIPEYSGKLYGLFLGPKCYKLQSPEDLRLEGKCPLCGVDRAKAKHVNGRCTRVKAKGLESGQRNEETLNKLLRGAKQTQAGKAISAKNLVWVRRLEKVGSLARENFLRGPQMRKIPRRMLVGQTKREVLPDGTTRPFRVQMFEPVFDWSKLDRRPWPILKAGQQWRKIHTHRASSNSTSTTPKRITSRRSTSSKTTPRKKTRTSSSSTRRLKGSKGS